MKIVLFVTFTERRERAIKMPVPKTIVETNENESMPDQIPVDELLNTKSRGKKKKNNKDLGPLIGLPELDRPEAGKVEVKRKLI